MRMMMTGRHVTITAALRRSIETRMKRLERDGVKLILVNAALDRLAVRQRLDHGGVELIEPQPASCRNG
jgi:ribosome-associated translation inhibitor RaiA